MAYEAFDSETLHILGGAMDEPWRRVKLNHLNGGANAARTVLASHIFRYGQKRRAGPSASHCRCVDAANALSGYPSSSHLQSHAALSKK
jgi:hypothetical protein